jgi:catechol 2,3-dioxygenase-like lactoylglutathione lyase family enzyme
MDNVGIVVDDLDAAVAFFTELGLELEGEAQIEGRWADRAVGLDGVRNDIAMMRTPDGHSKLELTKFHTPAAAGAEPENPAAQHAGPASRHVRRQRHRGRPCSPARSRRRTPR